MISRRTLLGGAAAVAAGSLAGCSSKFRSYDGPPVTGIIVSKAERRMYLLSGNTALRAFDIRLGGDPVGPKHVEGDGKTPEGAYFIDRRNPESSYHLSLGISYPSPQDMAYAQALGQRPGGDIFIHGTPREKRRGGDWTAGCIAVTNREMEDIYAMVGDGTPIYIYP
jgi:murein L,D-transpeptidase YafK